MELSLFLGQLLGFTLVLFAIAGLVRPQLLSAAIKGFDHESFSTLAVGLIAMAAGLAIVLSHNIWDGTWRVWITLFGWAALIKGFAYLIAPQWLTKMGKTLLKDAMWMRAFLLAALILGAYLAYKGLGH